MKPKIIGITGKTCSGKSFLLSILNTKTKCHCIDLDLIDTGISKKERLYIIENFGIEALERKVVYVIKKAVIIMIENTPSETVVIEGIKLKKYFSDIIDVFIEFDVPKEQRLKNAFKKGWTEEKFNFIEGLSDE